MMEPVTHQMMMLRPMQAGLSGYARLQSESGRQLVQINLRGLRGGGMAAYWYAGDGLVRELGRTEANARGEAGLYTELTMEAAAPLRLMALLIASSEDRPRPLAIGLCTAQSAGSLMDAKNALLALCDRLTREAQARKEQAQRQEKAETPPVKATEAGKASIPPKEAALQGQAAEKASKITETSPADSGAQRSQLATERKAAPPTRQTRRTAGRTERSRYAPADDPPREVFLPAIDAQAHQERRRNRRAGLPQDGPSSRVAFSSAASPGEPPKPTVTGPEAPGTVAQHPASWQTRPAGEPADQLPQLYWPADFQPLAPYFDRCLPVRLMNWPGWRFVQAAQEPNALWIGCQRENDRIIRVAYALPGHIQPPQGQPFRPATAADGKPLQLLVLRSQSQP